MFDLDLLFQKSQLIPVIIQHARTNQVLMLGFTNREAVELTLQTRTAWFWSRSRNELWNKGATSGHLQKITEIYSDCDDDTLLVLAHQTGAACHTGNKTCFFTRIFEGEDQDA